MCLNPRVQRSIREPKIKHRTFDYTGLLTESGVITGKSQTEAFMWVVFNANQNVILQ